MDGFRQQDELNALRGRLPAFDKRLRLKMPLEHKLRALNPEELDLLQDLLGAPSLEAIFDSAAGSDLEAAKAVAALVQRGYLETVD